MSALRWATVPVVIGVLTGKVAFAAADEPPLAPTPTPAAAPDPTPTPTPTPPVQGTEGYVSTVTTTTTIVNAPIIVVAAPITTTNNYPMSPALPEQARGRLVLNLNGCGRADGRAALPRVRRANVRLAPNASLVVRVNGRRITTVRLPSPASPAPRRASGVALRLRLARSGILTIRRPSGRVLSIQGCTPG